jgi:hypothetical protein
LQPHGRKTLSSVDKHGHGVSEVELNFFVEQVTEFVGRHYCVGVVTLISSGWFPSIVEVGEPLVELRGKLCKHQGYLLGFEYIKQARKLGSNEVIEIPVGSEKDWSYSVDRPAIAHDQE